LVGGDDWPTTRYDLFETAIRRLVHEQNGEHRWTDRSAPDAIIAAAAEACLVLLVSGSLTLWRSNAEPPVNAGEKMHQRAGVKLHHGWMPNAPTGGLLLRDKQDEKCVASPANVPETSSVA